MTDANNCVPFAGPMPAVAQSAHGVRHTAELALLLVLPTCVGLWLDERISVTTQAMLYVLAVVLGAYRLPALGALWCAVLAVVGLNFFFVPPRWTFAVDSQEHLVALGAMLTVALVINQLSLRLRREAALARLHAWRAQQLQSLASALAGATDAATAAQAGALCLQQAFAGRALLALRVGDGSLQALDGAGVDAGSVHDGLRAAMREAAVLGPGTGRWPGLNAWYLPLGVAGQMYGAACVQGIEASDCAGREHAQAVCALVAQALERLRLAQAMRQAEAHSARQQWQNTFLAAVSHDLRTPLAALLGNATSLQSQRDKMTPAAQAQLLDGMVDAARHLSELTEHTLQLVQLTHANTQVMMDWESMEEIVGACVARWRMRPEAQRLRVRLGSGLPWVWINAVLMAQLVDNLVDNALKYSADAVTVKVRWASGVLLVLVQDRGAVLAPAVRDAVFAPYARAERADRADPGRQRGVGLGLALCRAIAQVHGGTLVVRPRAGGGNSFVLHMPARSITPEVLEP